MKQSIDALIAGIRDAAAQAVEQMIEQMGVNNIIAKLQSLPGQIEHQEAILKDTRDKADEAKGEMELAKQIVVAMVAEEREINGKAMYSNAEARNAEVTRRLASDEEYLEAKKEFQGAEDNVSSAQFELTRLHNEFGAAKVIGQMLADKMRLLSGF